MIRSHFPTDTATIQANLREVSTFTDDQIEAMSVAELRVLLRKCGIKQVKRGEESKPVANAKRSEAVEALQLAVTPYKILANAIIDPGLMMTDDDITKLNYEDVYQLLKIALKEDSNDKRREKALKLASEVNNWVEKHYPDREEQARFHSRSQQRGQYRTQVENLVIKDGEVALVGLYSVYASYLKELGSADAMAKARANSDRVKRYETNRRTIDTTALKQWAVKTLSDLQPTDSDSPASRWKSVAIAVAAVTGRRIYSEIMTDTGRFAVAGEYEIAFSGVAKGKEFNTDTYIIPSLCPAKDVVKAIDWLGCINRRIHCENPKEWTEVKEARAKADTRYSKDVGKFWKDNLCKQLLGLETDDEEAAKEDLVKIHGLRKFYVMHFIKGMSDRQARARAAELLCHSSDGSVASDAYTSEFEIV